MRRRLGIGLAERGGGGEEQSGSEDAWAEMLMSLEKFDYDRCGIRKAPSSSPRTNSLTVRTVQLN